MEQLTKADIVEHWPFFAVVLILMVIMQVIKTSVFTKVRANKKAKMQWLWWWGYKTLAVQPILFGAILGAFWPNPEVGITGIASIVYCASAGSCSVWAYQVLKGLAKKRDIDLTLPGTESNSTVPPKE